MSNISDQVGSRAYYMTALITIAIGLIVHPFKVCTCKIYQASDIHICLEVGDCD